MRIERHNVPEIDQTFSHDFMDTEVCNEYNHTAENSCSNISNKSIDSGVAFEFGNVSGDESVPDDQEISSTFGLRDIRAKMMLKPKWFDDIKVIPNIDQPPIFIKLNTLKDITDALRLRDGRYIIKLLVEKLAFYDILGPKKFCQIFNILAQDFYKKVHRIPAVGYFCLKLRYKFVQLLSPSFRDRLLNRIMDKPRKKDNFCPIIFEQLKKKTRSS